MRILHTSDLHFGISIGNVPLIEDQRFMVERLIETARKERVDAVVVAGDVYDHAVVSADAIALYDRLVTALCLEEHTPVLLCAGNHDGAARLSACGSLLARAGLHIAGSIKDGHQAVEIGDCLFHLLPYFSLDEARYIHPEAGIGNLADAFRALLESIKTTFQPGKKNILIAHCYVNGAEVSESDRAVAVGGTEGIPAAIFDGFDYVALGHLHRAQQPFANVRYSGSPMKLSFGEGGYTKSVTLLDTDSMEIKEVPVAALRDMRVVKGTYEQALAAAECDEKNDDYIKVVLEDVYAHMEIQEAFRHFYPNLLSLEGKAYTGGAQLTSLRVDEVAALSVEDIMRRFYTEYTEGKEPSEQQLLWFRDAIDSIQAEGGAE